MKAAHALAVNVCCKIIFEKIFSTEWLRRCLDDGSFDKNWYSNQHDPEISFADLGLNAWLGLHA
jgi:hypothetical protein